jgi:chromosome segregation and condensation protein ScpB
VVMKAAFLCALLAAGCASTQPGHAPGKVERLSAEALARILPKPEAKLSLDEIMTMGKSGASSETIIGRIRETRSRYRLNAKEIAVLHGAGVSEAVIDAMLEAERQSVLAGSAEELNRRDAQHAEDLRRLEQECRFWCGPAWGPYYGPFHPAPSYWWYRR